MQDVSAIPVDRVHATLSSIRRLVIAGSREPRVHDLIGEAAQGLRAAGSAIRPDPLDVLEAAYRLLLRRFVLVPDPSGEEYVQTAKSSMRRLKGDCDDATVLVAALARALGFRTGIVVLSVPTEDGGLYALHVYPEVQTGPASWIPADLGDGLPFGEEPSYPTATDVQRIALEDEAPLGIGFLDGIASAIGSIFAGNAAKKVAKEQTAQATVTGAYNLAASKEAADAARFTANQQLAAAREYAEALETQAIVEGQLGARRDETAREMTQRVLALVRELAPVAAVVLVLKALAPVAEQLVSKRPTYRRAPARAAA